MKNRHNRILYTYYKFNHIIYEHVIVPEIRLEGKWLEQLGFEK